MVQNLPQLAVSSGTCRSVRLPLTRFFSCEQYRSSVKVDVADSGPAEFAPPRTGVGRHNGHRVQEIVGRPLLDEGQQFVRFRQRQEQAVPEFCLFDFGQAAEADLPLDLGPCLERRLLRGFRKRSLSRGNFPFTYPWATAQDQTG